MGNKIFLLSVVFLSIISGHSFAYDKDLKSNITHSCYNNLGANEIKNLVISDISVKVDKNRQWIENLMKLHLFLEEKKNKTNLNFWINNFRIGDQYKKRFNADIFVKFKDFKICKFKADIRVTGDLWWHLTWFKGSPISSLHIRLLEGNIFNITQFKLLLKDSRFGDNEIFVANFFRHLGFISPKTFYVNAKINNVVNQYIFQEDIRKELIESYNLKEGPLLEGDERFSVNLSDDELAEFPEINFAKILNTNFSRKNSSNSLVSLEALSNLNRLFLFNHVYRRSNNIKVHNLYTDSLFLFSNNFFEEENLKVLNSFEALAYGTDIVHGLAMDDRRFYYDTINKFYYPIYYDGKSNILENIQLTKIEKGSNFSNEAMQGAELAIKTLQKLNLKKFLADLRKSGMNISEQQLEDALNRIKKRISFLNNQKIKIHNIKEHDIFFNNNIKKANLINFVFTNFKTKSFSVCDSNLSECDVLNFDNDEYFKILNEVLNQKFYTLKSKIQTKQFLVFLFNNKSQVSKFNYLDNNWSHQKLPSGLKILYKNINLTLNQDKKEIMLRQISSDGKLLFLNGRLNGWQITFNGKQNYKNSDIKNNYDLTNNLTGCINFYKVNFNDVKIKSINSNCEDSINIVNSEGNIDEIFSKNSASDSLDIDFSNLAIRNINISSAYNDCVDVSSGIYEFKNLLLKNCGDKAISIGEKSSVDIDSVEAKNSNLGIASKDSSFTKIQNAKIENVKICLSAYKKKQEFNGSKIILNSMSCENFFLKTDIDFNSNITLNNKRLDSYEFGNIYNFKDMIISNKDEKDNPINLLSGVETFNKKNSLNAVVEISKGQTHKWEVSKLTGKLHREFWMGIPRKVDSSPYPINYGMIPRTVIPARAGGDGNPLDILIFGEPVQQGKIVKVKIIGIMKMIDFGEKDDKILAVPNNLEFKDINNIKNLETLIPNSKKQLEEWFNHYKGENSTQVTGFKSEKEALFLIKKANNYFNKYGIRSRE